MKQKLLLALFVLFASVGAMRAQTSITVPANSARVTLTFSGGSAINVTSDKPAEITKNTGDTEFYLDPNSGDIVYSIAGTYTGLTVNGKATAATISSGDITTLEFKNNGELATLSIESGASKLASIRCTGNSLTETGITGLGNVAATCSLDCSNNKIKSTSWDLSGSNLKSITVSGNEIIAIKNKASNPFTITWGTQTVSAKAATPNRRAQAYVDAFLDIVKENSLFGLSADNEANRAKVTYSWKKDGASSFNNVGVQKGTYDANYRFYNASSNEYDSGTFLCQVTSGNPITASGVTYAPTCIASMTIDPVQYTITIKNSDGGDFKVTTVGSTPTEVTDATSLDKGSKVLFAPKAKDGYKFKEYKLEGLVATTTTNVYEVKGVKDQTILKAEAIFESNQYIVNHSLASQNGSYDVKIGDNILESGKAVTYGQEIVISVRPDAGYQAVVLVNNDRKVVTNGKVTHPVTGATTISVSFELGTSSTALKIPTTELGKLSELFINGDKVTDLTTEKTSNFNTGQKISLKLKSGTSGAVTKIIFNTTEIPFTKSGDYLLANFDIRESGILSFVTTALATLTIVPDPTVTTNSVQKFIYDSNTKPFLYTVEVSGQVADLTVNVEYSSTSTPTIWSSAAPTACGTYHVRYKRAADNLYSKVESTNYPSTSTYSITIEKAIASIIKAPTSVTLDANTKTYKVSTDGEAQVNSKKVNGTFEVKYYYDPTDDSENEVKNNTCILSKNHLVKVAFIATDKDNIDNAKAFVILPAKVETTGITEYEVSYTVPTGMIMTVKNGEAIVKSGAKIAKGTLLTVEVVYPIGYTTVIVKENKANGQEIATAETSTPPLTTKYKNVKVEGRLDMIVVSTGSASEAKEVKISIANDDLRTGDDGPKYNDGALITADIYGVTDITLKESNGTVIPNGDGLTALQGKMTISYKNAKGEVVKSLVNAGMYTVCIKIEAVSGTGYNYKAASVEIKDALEVSKKSLTIADANWPTTAIAGIGQTLGETAISGGVASIPGKFVFVDETKTPVDGQSYPIKFVPADADNYNELSTGKTAKVSVTNKLVVTWGNVLNGTLVVKDKATGRVYASGEALISGSKEIIITATPATGYKLETLTVNGSSFTSGSTYTIGAKSVQIAATFEAYFTVSVTAPTKGLVVTLPASKEVKKGGSYVITLAHLVGDKPVVKDGSTAITGVDGKYTISNITANKAITITLDTPTAIAVKADATLSPQGKSMGTITFTGLTDGKCYYGDKVTAKATPVSGVQFSGWNGLTSTENPLTMTVTGTLTLKALYLGSPTGIDDIEGTKVYGAEGYIYVSCEGQATVTVVTMDGRSQQVRIVGEARIETGAGIYGVILQQGAEVLKTKVVVR